MAREQGEQVWKGPTKTYLYGHLTPTAAKTKVSGATSSRHVLIRAIPHGPRSKKKGIASIRVVDEAGPGVMQATEVTCPSKKKKK